MTEGDKATNMEGELTAIKECLLFIKKQQFLIRDCHLFRLHNLY